MPDFRRKRDSRGPGGASSRSAAAVAAPLTFPMNFERRTAPATRLQTRARAVFNRLAERRSAGGLPRNRENSGPAGARQLSPPCASSAEPRRGMRTRDNADAAGLNRRLSFGHRKREPPIVRCPARLGSALTPVSVRALLPAGGGVPPRAHARAGNAPARPRAGSCGPQSPSGGDRPSLPGRMRLPECPVGQASGAVRYQHIKNALT